jgi:hypothetical protein
MKTQISLEAAKGLKLEGYAFTGSEKHLILHFKTEKFAFLRIAGAAGEPSIGIEEGVFSPIFLTTPDLQVLGFKDLIGGSFNLRRNS